MLSALAFMMIPLLITTALLSLHARWAWGRTVDKVLRGMKVDAVRDKVELAEKHRTWARRHAIVAGSVFAVSLFLSLFQSGAMTDTGFFLIFLPFVWFYCILVPHILALYLFHVRWNPGTLERKQKLDEEDSVYEGNYDLNPDMRYGVNEEGELVELGLLAEIDTQQQMQKG